MEITLEMTLLCSLCPRSWGPHLMSLSSSPWWVVSPIPLDSPPFFGVNMGRGTWGAWGDGDPGYPRASRPDPGGHHAASFQSVVSSRGRPCPSSHLKCSPSPSSLSHISNPSLSSPVLPVISEKQALLVSVPSVSSAGESSESVECALGDAGERGHCHVIRPVCDPAATRAQAVGPGKPVGEGHARPECKRCRSTSQIRIPPT